MKAKFWLWPVFLAILFATPNVFSQTPPPNDNLANATVLTGTDITFTGSLANATLEPGEIFADFGTNLLYVYPLSNSVWWSWTASASTALNLDIQFDYIPPSQDFDYLFVYTATNGTVTPSGLIQPSITNRLLTRSFLPHYVVAFPVTAGTTYLIQLIGSRTDLHYTFHLLATNTPLIYRQPISQTVSSNASTVFYVASDGVKRAFQWYLNGTNIAGETAPILALNHIDSSMAGNYSVLVSNAFGSILTDPAKLIVSQSNVPPVLTSQGRESNLLTFNLNGEPGRAYRIETSTNLINWKASNTFVFSPAVNPFNIWLGSVVYATNLPLKLSAMNDAPRAYYSASIYKTHDANSEFCINNIRQILIAKQLWRTEEKIAPTATPSLRELAAYLRSTNFYCPLDTGQSLPTSYSLNSLNATPTCEISTTNHVLEGVP